MHLNENDAVQTLMERATGPLRRATFPPFFVRPAFALQAGLTTRMTRN